MSFIVENCPCEPDCITNGGSKIGPRLCSFVDRGFCPKGYYCPTYTPVLLQQAKTQNLLSASSCVFGPAALNVTRSANLLVVCPCTPGFFCPENSSIPTYCPAGVYCPSNPSITVTPFGTPVPSTGLGAWGTLLYNCPAGSWCGYNTINPLNCGFDGQLNSCSVNAQKKNSTPLIILIILVMVFLYLFFEMLRFIRNRRKMLESLMERKELSATEDPNDANSQFDSKKLISEASKRDVGDSGAQIIVEEGKTENSKFVSLSQPEDLSKKEFLIEFEDITFTLKTGVTIMQGVSGSFKPSRLCAIMGPSGAGKSTIISLVTGKTERTSGKVKLNGKEVEGLMDISKIVGFVPQEDTMIRSMTVRDTITFSARYRLQSSLSRADIDQRVTECLYELGIPHVQHSIIGDELTRGISGGQRKRVNIAIEMIAEPNILFLDEPTSGLDSTTTVALCDTLKGIALNRRMTIAAVIHQPSIGAFKTFDDLLLLGKGGRVVYHGAISDAEKYFNSIGFKTPEETNPADFYMNVVSGGVPREGFPEFKKEDLFDLWNTERGLATPAPVEIMKDVVLEDAQAEDEKPLPPNIFQRLVKRLTHYHITKFIVLWVTHLFWLVIEWAVDLFVLFKKTYGQPCKVDPVRQTPGSWTQFAICFERAFKQILTDFFSFGSEMLIHLFMGFIVVSAGQTYYAPPLPAPVCAQVSPVLVSICSLPPVAVVQLTIIGNFAAFAVTFASVAMGAGLFSSERANYFREASSGLNTIPYFIAKIVANIPRLASAAFFFWVAFSTGYNNTGDFGYWYATVLMMYWFGYSLGFVASQLVPDRYIAITGVLVALIFCLVLGGIDPSLQTVSEKPSSQQGLWYLSGPRWTTEAFAINTIQYYQYVPPGIPFAGAPYANVDNYLNNYSYSLSDFALCMWATLLDGFFWSFIALILMGVFNLDKKK